MSSDTSRPTHAAGDVDAEQVLLAWDARVRVLLNPAVWGGVLAAFGIGAFALTILMLIISKSLWALAVGAGIFALLMAIFVAVGVVIDVFGGFRTGFALTSRGVHSIAGKGAKHAADAAFWTGVLTGSLGAAGAGLLARSEQHVFIAYPEVTKVKVHPPRRSIVVKGGFLDKPIGLYCTAENFDRAEAILREQCPAALR